MSSCHHEHVAAVAATRELPIILAHSWVLDGKGYGPEESRYLSALTIHREESWDGQNVYDMSTLDHDSRASVARKGAISESEASP